MAGGIGREEALSKAFEFIYKSEIYGVYCEFGVYQGVSLGRAIKSEIKWRKKTGKNYISHFYGFDSFKGLPDISEVEEMTNYKVFQTGQFHDTSKNIVLQYLQEQNISVEQVTLIEGYYDDSLVSESTRALVRSQRVAIAHIDCDLYKSANSCLNFLTDSLSDGAIILFDDWFCYRGHPKYGVHKAFDEWCAKKEYLVSEYFTYSWAGKAFIINDPQI